MAGIPVAYPDCEAAYADPRPPHSEGIPIDRDMNLVVDEVVSWASIRAAIELTQCDALESVRLGEIWRDADRLGEGKKSVVVSIRLRSSKETLSAEQANSFVEAMVRSCQDHVGAALRG